MSESPSHPYSYLPFKPINICWRACSSLFIQMSALDQQVTVTANVFALCVMDMYRKYESSRLQNTIISTTQSALSFQTSLT